MVTERDRARCDELSGQIIGAAIEVHRVLGPGLLESAYELSLCKELALRGIQYERQVAIPLRYKGEPIGAGYRLDVVVEDLVIAELKSVNSIEAIHETQLLTHLKLSEKWLGLILNFNVRLMRDGVKRLVLG